MSAQKTVLLIGGAGAQGVPIAKGIAPRRKTVDNPLFTSSQLYLSTLNTLSAF